MFLVHSNMHLLAHLLLDLIQPIILYFFICSDELSAPKNWSVLTRNQQAGSLSLQRYLSHHETLQSNQQANHFRDAVNIVVQKVFIKFDVCPSGSVNYVGVQESVQNILQLI